MVIRLNKICLNKELQRPPYLEGLHSLWRERERTQLRIRQLGIQGLNTNQERLLYPSSEDYNTTGGNEYDGSESLLRCYIRVEIFLSR